MAAPATGLPAAPGQAGYSRVCLRQASGQNPWSTGTVTAEIVACLKHPEVLVIDGAGHLPNLEAEREFNDALRGFLPTPRARLRPRPSPIPAAAQAAAARRSPGIWSVKPRRRWRLQCRRRRLGGWQSGVLTLAGGCWADPAASAAGARMRIGPAVGARTGKLTVGAATSRDR